MSDKKLLIILTLLAIYIFGVKPLYDSLPLKIYQLRTLERLFYKEDFINKKSKIIEKLYPKYMEVAKQNEELFYPYNTPISAAMSNMQHFIKVVSEKNNIQLMRINWGTQEDKGDYIVLPMFFTVRGNPAQIGSFLRSLYNFKKLIRFESIYINASVYSKVISLNAIVKCFKLKSGRL